MDERVIQEQSFAGQRGFTMYDSRRSKGLNWEGREVCWTAEGEMLFVSFDRNGRKSFVLGKEEIVALRRLLAAQSDASAPSSPGTWIDRVARGESCA